MNYQTDSKVENRAKFWAYHRCHEDDFVAQAETGDLLLIQKEETADKKIDEVFIVVESHLGTNHGKQIMFKKVEYLQLLSFNKQTGAVEVSKWW